VTRAPSPLGKPWQQGVCWLVRGEPGPLRAARREGEAFLPRYEELLRLTGRDTAEGVAQRSLGVALEAPDFWNASIDLIEADAACFAEAADALFGSS